MRAAIARNRAIVVDDIADPVPGPGDALVRVVACGICGSDLHALVHADELVAAAAEVGVPLPFDPHLDYVMGHEFSAEVVELGPATDGVPVAPGDLVTSLPVALTATGMEPVGAYSNVYNGGYAELMRLTAGICLKVPNGLDARRAALTEPMAVGRHAVARGGVTPPTPRSCSVPDRSGWPSSPSCTGSASRRSSSATSRRAGARRARDGSDRGRSILPTTIRSTRGSGSTGAAPGGVRRDRCSRLARARHLARAGDVARRRGRLVHAERHDPSGAAADEAADDRVLVRVRPVRVRRHAAGDRRRRDRRDADDHRCLRDRRGRRRVRRARLTRRPRQDPRRAGRTERADAGPRRSQGIAALSLRRAPSARRGSARRSARTGGASSRARRRRPT